MLRNEHGKYRGRVEGRGTKEEGGGGRSGSDAGGGGGGRETEGAQEAFAHGGGVPLVPAADALEFAFAWGLLGMKGWLEGRKERFRPRIRTITGIAKLPPSHQAFFEKHLYTPASPPSPPATRIVPVARLTPRTIRPRSRRTDQAHHFSTSVSSGTRTEDKTAPITCFPVACGREGGEDGVRRQPRRKLDVGEAASFVALCFA